MVLYSANIVGESENDNIIFKTISKFPWLKIHRPKNNNMTLAMANTSSWNLVWWIYSDWHIRAIVFCSPQSESVYLYIFFLFSKSHPWIKSFILHTYEHNLFLNISQHVHALSGIGYIDVITDGNWSIYCMYVKWQLQFVEMNDFIKHRKNWMEASNIKSVIGKWCGEHLIVLWPAISVFF